MNDIGWGKSGGKGWGAAGTESAPKLKLGPQNNFPGAGAESVEDGESRLLFSVPNMTH